MAPLAIVDLDSFDTPSALADELMRVGRNPGFFYLRGLGIPSRDIEDIFSLSGQFFLNTNDDEKRRWQNGSGDTVRGTSCVKDIWD